MLLKRGDFCEAHILLPQQRNNKGCKTQSTSNISTVHTGSAWYGGCYFC